MFAHSEARPTTLAKNMEEKRRMLLVEDSFADVMLVRLAMEEAGVPVEMTHLADGEEAINYFDQNSSEGVSFILLDLNIPKASGIDILMRKSTIEGWKNVPVVLYSSSMRPEDVRAAMVAGASAYVIKPVDFEQFNRTIQYVAVFWGELNRATLPYG